MDRTGPSLSLGRVSGLKSSRRSGGNNKHQLLLEQGAQAETWLKGIGAFGTIAVAIYEIICLRLPYILAEM